MSFSKFKSVIIGAGRIGAFFDTPNSREVITHAHAYSKHERIDLKGIYDLDYSRATKAAKLWKSRVFNDLDEMLSLIKPDIISICTPDETHVRTLELVLRYNPKLVICEKPLNANTKDSKSVVEKYKKAGVGLQINYSRRFVPSFRVLAKEISDGKYGRALVSSAIYTKGTLHNGSHMIDMARMFFGEIKKIQNLYSVQDFTKSDKTVGAFLAFSRCSQFYLTVADERAYSIFELDILCEKARIRILNSGGDIEKQIVVPDPIYKGYKILGSVSKKKTELNESTKLLIDNSVRYLDGDDVLLSPGSEALKTEAVCVSLKSSKYVK